MDIHDVMQKKIETAGIDINEVIFRLTNMDIIPSIANIIGTKAILLSKEKITEIFASMPKALEWGLDMVTADVLNAAINNICTNIEKVKINGVECFLTEERPLSKEGVDGYYMFDIRHDESGEPCNIEKNVVVNYFGTILSPVNFLENGEEYVDINHCPECGNDCSDFIYLES